MNLYKIQTALYAISLLVIFGTSALLMLELFEGFVNPAYHATMWTVNVNRFIMMLFGLFLGGVAFGMVIITLILRSKKSNDRKKMIKKVLKIQ